MAIVRDLTQLDSTDAPASRDVAHNHQALDKVNETVKTVKTKKGKEIPVPEVRNVASYTVDYLPIFRPPQTYIHGHGVWRYTILCIPFCLNIYILCTYTNLCTKLTSFHLEGLLPLALMYMRNITMQHDDHVLLSSSIMSRSVRNHALGVVGGQGYSDETFVEYDLDKEDEAWLQRFNAGQPRISSAKFETMLWVLVRVGTAGCVGIV